MKPISDFNVQGKRILVRCDFNVPIDEDGNILDDFRIRKALPTIQYLIEKNAKIVLMSHLDPDETGTVGPKFNLNKVAEKLSQHLNKKVAKADDCVGQEVEDFSHQLKDGEILLLENLRFHEGETKENPDFAKRLSLLGDAYVNEAFSVCHRAHASVALVPQHLPHFAGLQLVKEVENLNKAMENPLKPFLVLVGGKKVETKAAFIGKMLSLADMVIVGGLLEKEIIDKKLFFSNSEKMIKPAGNLEGLDIDEATISLFKEKIMQSKTIVWNGPFGKFEDADHKKGTLEVAKAIIESGAFSVVGGGETIEFLDREGMIDKFSHVSTGGGAMLAYLAGEELPGLKALE